MTYVIELWDEKGEYVDSYPTVLQAMKEKSLMAHFSDDPDWSWSKTRLKIKFWIPPIPYYCPMNDMFKVNVYLHGNHIGMEGFAKSGANSCLNDLVLRINDEFLNSKWLEWID